MMTSKCRMFEIAECEEVRKSSFGAELRKALDFKIQRIRGYFL